MGWRPNWWYRKRGGETEHSDPKCKCIECEAYEAGAEAILEALKEKSEEPFIVDSLAPLTLETVVSISGQKGFAVFVPESD